jgi:histidinol-phosphate aminotransferase
MAEESGARGSSQKRECALRPVHRTGRFHFEAMTTLMTRAEFRDLELYAPDRAPVAMDLSDNTNLWGAAPSAMRAVARAADGGAGRGGALARYPSAYADDLRGALARYHGVQVECIVTGCGSDDVLDSAFRAFGNAGDVVAAPTPTFVMVPVFAKVNALRLVGVPLRADFDLDDEGVIREKARLTYLCTPNNPTGGAFSRERVERVVDEAKGVVIIDEAYVDFGGRSFLDLVERSERVLIVRTFSKGWGLAGLRVGYAIGAPRLVAEVAKARGPYKVNAIAELAAREAVTRDREWLAGVVADVRRNRAWLTAELRGMRLVCLESSANFVFVKVKEASALTTRLRERGVAVRGFPDGIRVTVGPREMMQRFVATLEEVLCA